MSVPPLEAGPRRRPWVCIALGVVWTGVFAADLSGAAVAPDRFGLFPGAVAVPGALTFSVLHAGPVHLAVSLVLLGLAGPQLEVRWGPRTLALFGAIALAAGAAAGVHLAPDPSRPLVGPAAALTAIVAAGAACLRLATPRLAALPGAWLAGAVLVRASSATAPVDAGLDLRVQGGIALGAVLLAIPIDRLDLESRWLRRRRRAARERAMVTHIARARRELAAERPDAAFALLEESLAETPHPRIIEALIEAGELCGRRGDALARGARAVTEAWNAGRRELAAAMWAPLVRAEPDLPLGMRLRLALAPLLGATGSSREAALTLRGELRARRRQLTPGAALRIADAARAVHPPTAIEAARLALASEAIDAGKRARIEAMIDAMEADPRRWVAAELDVASDAPPSRLDPSKCAGHATTQAPDDELPDPRALSLPEEADSLELATPRCGDATGGTVAEDPRALVLDPEEPDGRRTGE